MPRQHNTDRHGNDWTEQTKLNVWQKGAPIPDYRQDLWRRDMCGRAMKYTDHGNRKSDYGWEIDHINPVSNEGGDNIENLQPLFWENNMNKSDSLNWTCP